MPRPKTKKKAVSPRTNNPLAELDPLRAGMPALDSITAVKKIERGGKGIRIIKTTEIDSYDEPPLKKGRRKRKQS